MVEFSAVNRTVAGSSPAFPATLALTCFLSVLSCTRDDDYSTYRSKNSHIALSDSGSPIDSPNPDFLLHLQAGYLNASGRFEKASKSVSVNPSDGISYIQVAAFPRMSAIDTMIEMIRIKYTSDRSEWVGTNGTGSYVFLSEEECQESGFFCEEVVVGESESGCFESAEGEKISIGNVHCSALDLPYDITVSAQAFDISYFDYHPVGDVKRITLTCVESSFN